ncbi:hypothetical protein [Parafilimonas sp.]|uniref:hypothetical protein n=1 Tax=Parafilimonas sp. TaxID=1969739 RepID=UPI0039E3AF98
MLYEKDLLDKWTEYSVLKTAEEKGMEKGAEQKSYEVVKNLINKFGFNDQQAANAAEVSIAFVKKVRASLKKKK